MRLRVKHSLLSARVFRESQFYVPLTRIRLRSEWADGKSIADFAFSAITVTYRPGIHLPTQKFALSI